MKNKKINIKQKNTKKLISINANNINNNYRNNNNNDDNFVIVKKYPSTHP